MKNTPEQPLGSQWSDARFDPVKSTKARIVFTHNGKARSGVSEAMVSNDCRPSLICHWRLNAVDTRGRTN